MLRGSTNRDNKPDNTYLETTSVSSIVPEFYETQYPKFIEFLETYLAYQRDEEGFGNLLENLKEIRNIEVTDSEFGRLLRKEYGSDFPDLGTIDDNTAIRLFEYWYRSKGTPEAIRAYFRLFLNADAEVVFPQDNMFIIDGGDWNSQENRYNTVDSHIDESTMVMQDDDFYQIFSYLIVSGTSIVDWGPAYERLAHPAGWNFFGEVQISELAVFENSGSTPTITPGLQSPDSELSIFSAAMMAMGASAQVIDKFLHKILASSDNFSVREVNYHMQLSTYTVGSFYDKPVSYFDEEGSEDRFTSRMRPSRIIIRTSS